MISILHHVDYTIIRTLVKEKKGGRRGENVIFYTTITHVRFSVRLDETIHVDVYVPEFLSKYCATLCLNGLPDVAF